MLSVFFLRRPRFRISKTDIDCLVFKIEQKSTLEIQFVSMFRLISLNFNRTTRV